MRELKQFQRTVRRVVGDNLYRDMAKSLGTTCRCGTCGRVQEVDPADCLRRGWPKCCGYTMTLLGKGEQ
jgi:hypothetical protein